MRTKSVLKNLYKKYRLEFLYVIYGVLTVIINVIVYCLFYRILHFYNMTSTILAWIVAVSFAFLTNRNIVFEKKDNNNILFEVILFFSCRLSTGVIDLIIMLISVDILHLNVVFWKIISNAISTVLNYIASKYYIFRDTKDKKRWR